MTIKLNLAYQKFKIILENQQMSIVMGIFFINNFPAFSGIFFKEVF